MADLTAPSSPERLDVKALEEPGDRGSYLKINHRNRSVGSYVVSETELASIEHYSKDQRTWASIGSGILGIGLNFFFDHFTSETSDFNKRTITIIVVLGAFAAFAFFKALCYGLRKGWLIESMRSKPDPDVALEIIRVGKKRLLRFIRKFDTEGDPPRE